jgi:hypothetical protein
MSRYIDADVLIADLDKGLWGKDWDKALAEAIINNAPTIDAVSVVRCKQCKYAEVADPTDDQDGYICQFHRGSIWFSGSYCSWGERKESE